MEAFSALIGTINGFVWGPWMLVLLVGTGIFLSLRLGFLQFSSLPYALKLAFSPARQDKKSKGDISHFQALMTALAATIGTGNIVGVATAVVLGGPGAVFWMWITAVFGMATKYGEGVLAVKYRVTDEKGEMAGGPMYYIEKGMGQKWLAYIFAFFGAFAAFGIGNMVQANSVAGAVHDTFGVSTWITGLILTVLTAAVILGGIKSIGKATGIIVPFMAVFYVLAGLIIILINIDKVPAAFSIIFSSAFNLQAGFGALIGSTIRYGVARGVFSNEAGLGSAPIAAAAAKTDHPCRQALVSMTGTFLDTIIVCTITGLTLVMAGLYPGLEKAQAAALTSRSFDSFFPGIGSLIVTIGLVFFAYSTVLGWSYYGEKCFYYLVGRKGIIFYRILFSLAVLVGATRELSLVWDIADTLNGAMAIPNLIALLALSGVIAAETRDFKKIRAKETARDTATS
ncbi:alanine or glycine:cation symporter, AGCS family [Desulfotomaculum arcticum]|uniref:Alanine or glycine:cation symporter, AGCS family n=1 Tax=Desulfotruncus arcticus DSM 17038 TaxID=1121424 RepID=A0A1I2WB05_9FIRM|nr:sodium:alanine symporter family protein [Desulfotruncus arcticus]SFG98515.1 alanine or glycine:cation symporter, AGCS family [Desulfotomaculum arcticum] [Desulfotruncus arcticus DSM 17038]